MFSENLRPSDKIISIVLVLTFIGVAAVVGWFIISHQSQVSKESFGIYLLEDNKLVISDEDIVWYNKTSHEIKLTQYGVEKIRAIEVPVSGRPFVIKLSDKEIYNGSFWASFSSMSYSGIVIDVLKIQNNIIKIEKGYPTPEFFEGKDPRNNSEIFDYFQKIGKLTQ